MPAIELVPNKKNGFGRPLRASKLESAEPFDVADLLKDTETEIDADGRYWPKILSPPRDRTRDLENTLKDQQSELLARCVQVADLCNIQQQQAGELEVARDAIASLDKSVTVLRDAVTQQEAQAAAAKQALLLADEEKNALSAQVAKSKEESDQLRKQIADFEVGSNRRKAAISAAQLRVQFLEAALSAADAKIATLTAAMKEADQRHHNELCQQNEKSALERKTLEGIVADRGMKLKELKTASVSLIERCNDLAKSVSILEATKAAADDKIKLQADHLVFLEVLLRAEREAAEFKIKELR